VILSSQAESFRPPEFVVDGYSDRLPLIVVEEFASVRVARKVKRTGSGKSGASTPEWTLHK
jgi:hypothetical protein